MAPDDPVLIPFSVAINAGGQSRRMGTDKAFVPLLGRPLIEHVLARVADLGAAETFIVTNAPKKYQPLGLPLYGDTIPGAGSLGGIYSALTHATTPYTIVIACDLPLASPELVRLLLARASEEDGPYDAIVPRYHGLPQTMHALYAHTALEAIGKHIAAGQYRIRTVFDDIRTRFVDKPEYVHIDRDGRAFQNINTPEDLAAVEALLRAE